MKSYTQMLNLLGNETGKNDSNGNLQTGLVSLFSQWLNDGIRLILGMPIAWKFLETSFTRTTTAGTGLYLFPYDYEKFIAIKIHVGSYDYTIKQIKNRDEWNRLTAVVIQSDYPQYYYLNNRSVEIFPVPATTANTITIYYKKRVVDLQNADYTTGTIAVTNNSTVVTGTGTTFTSAMVGRYIKVNADGNWYLITSLTSTTVIGIEQVYQGTTVSGAAYTIGEMSVLPENLDMLPVDYAKIQYWRQTNQITRADKYEESFLRKVQELKDNNILSSMDMGSADKTRVYNPNFYPQNLT